jgi:GNAT superfamily N-acetyltransferase
MNITIDYLPDDEKVISTIATWHYDQWNYLHKHDSVKNRIAHFNEHVGSRDIPLTVVATSDDGDVLGSSSLIMDDLDIRPDLNPWLASVFVPPEQRRKGLASVLVNRIVEEAARLNIETLYLYTPDMEELYSSLGWEVLERDHHIEDIVIMTIKP